MTSAYKLESEIGSERVKVTYYRGGEGYPLETEVRHYATFELAAEDLMQEMDRARPS